jgi:hypothetical protein
VRDVVLEESDHAPTGLARPIGRKGSVSAQS